MSDNLPADATPLNSSPSAFQPASIDVELPNGVIVTFTKPKHSLSLPINTLMASVQFLSPIVAETERSRIKCLMYISHINGQPEPLIVDAKMRAYLEERIGDENLDALFLKWNQAFPGANPADLKVIKKS